jgi:hypothetical protein
VVRILDKALVAKSTLRKNSSGPLKLCIVGVAAASSLHKGLYDEVLHTLCAATVADISKHMMKVL